MKRNWKSAFAAMAFGVAVALLSWWGIDQLSPGLFRESGAVFVLILVLMPFVVATGMGFFQDKVDEPTVRVGALVVWGMLLAYPTIFVRCGYTVYTINYTPWVIWLSLFVGSCLIAAGGFGAGILARYFQLRFAYALGTLPHYFDPH
ncbi:MAG: hypothetical protein AAB871_00465 [Patescibacteria group bacterium]